MTPDTAKTILTAMALGSYAKVAARAAGINEETLYAWLNRGKKRKEWEPPDVMDLADAARVKAWYDDEVYEKFLDDFLKAEADGELTMVANIRAGKNIKGNAFVLSRRHRERWGQSVEHRIDDGAATGLPAKPSRIIVEIAAPPLLEEPASDSSDELPLDDDDEHAT